jgi:(1->4)-alpha-D-glucan 1-alpha-D-glucosylmutase
MRIPSASYRIQFNPSFGFRDAEAIVEYLHELGISDIYASPIFKARSGSAHGYDIVDPTMLNPELGSGEEFNMLMDTLGRVPMGWLQDIVPNHMAYDGENRFLMDVLENGQSSEFLSFFDIDWDHPYEIIRGRVLAPFLGRPYGETLESGEISLRFDRNGFTINYFELKLPLKIESYTQILTHRLRVLRKGLGEDHPDFIKLLGILYSLKNLTTLREEIYERYNQILFSKRMLWELYLQNSQIKQFIDENVRIYNGEKGNVDTFTMLDALLAEQLFRLSFWKVATEEINYRRFFNINDLISLRVEDQNVWSEMHALVLQLLNEGNITGLRIDHIDGLFDPTGYLRALRERAEDTYIVVEKILDLKEELPSFWPVQGTTGYDFLNYVNGIFCDVNHGRSLNRIYYQFTDFRASCDSLLYEKKKLIIEKDMTGDVDNLAHLLKRISSKDRYGSDITLYGLKRAIVEVLALFPVYRTYASREVFRSPDRSFIKDAVKKARDLNPGLFHELNFIERFLQLKHYDHLPEVEKSERVSFVMRFQQLTGPLMAKGFEDTVLYVYNRLLSLNEVGGSPDSFGISVADFHAFIKERADSWTHSLNTTSTHDTKRGEDVRARINVLSEMPEQWASHLKKWSKINQKKKRRVKGKPVPDRNDEYMLYQTLIGVYPFLSDELDDFADRIKSYILKAVREAKVHTAWLKPDFDYEEAFLFFIEEILTPSEDNLFLRDFLPLQKMVAQYGTWNSLSQTLIKMTAPGVPDFYQGTELWDLNLVDPDNRRPVNFQKRRSFLRDVREKAEGDILKLIQELLSEKEDGRIKLFLIHRALQARRERADVFQKGKYLPLEVNGRLKDHVIAFARNYEDSWAITVAPRFLTSLIREGDFPIGQRVWSDSSLSTPRDFPGQWKDVMTSQVIEDQGSLKMNEVLKHFPVALLMSG